MFLPKNKPDTSQTMRMKTSVETTPVTWTGRILQKMSKARSAAVDKFLDISSTRPQPAPGSNGQYGSGAGY